MNYYRPLDQLRSSELTVVRSGFWIPEYLLTDGQFEYGKLSKVSFSASEKIIEIADTTFTLRRAGVFSREMLILNNGEVIGKIIRRVWKQITDVEFNDGFTASFLRTPGQGLFSTKMSWIANGNELLRIASKFSISTPMLVSVINPDVTKQTNRFLLLAFIGIHIRLVRQAQAAAN